MTRLCCFQFPAFVLVVLDEGETLEIDSEDVESTFNLFRMPPVWKSFFAFAKKVPCSVFPGGDPQKWVNVAITTVPVGWVGAVDLIQHIARRLVFNITRVPRASEVSSAGSVPSHLPYSLVCMDGLDVVSSSNAPANGTPSFINRFRLACDRHRLLSGGVGSFYVSSLHCSAGAVFR